MTDISLQPYVHEVAQPIRHLIVRYDDHANGVEGIGYIVGIDGVTRIEACMKNGEYAHIPYLRVWAGERCLGEFCQHHVAGVFFAYVDADPRACSRRAG